MTSARPLAGMTAVVTGTSGRLGPIWVGCLASAGATVVGIDRPGGPDVAGAAAIARADVRERAAVQAAADDIAAAYGIPGVVVNNAGVDGPPVAGGTARVGDVATPDFQDVLDVNVAGTFTVCQVFGELMLAAGGGSIVNIGSMYGTVAPDPSYYDHLDPPFLKPPAYGASKAAVINLTRYLARLWGPGGVRVNSLSPGGVLGGQDPEFIRKFSLRVPLRRPAEAEDLTGPLVFLASGASRYVTGQDLRVDGGFTA